MPGITTTSTNLVSENGAIGLIHAEPVAKIARELDSLSVVAEVINRTHDLRLIMQTALDQVTGILGIAHGLAYRLTNRAEVPEEQCLSLVAWRGYSDLFLRQFSMMPLYGSFAAQAASTGQPLVWRVADYPNPRLRQAYVAEDIQLGMTIPLMAHGQLVGTFSLGVGEVRAFSSADLQFLKLIGEQTSTAIEMSRLSEAADQAIIAGEASHLARTLHDSVTQHLYDMTLYAETIARLLDNDETTQAANYVQSMHAAALEALHEMHLLVSELHPPELTKVGLAAALQARLIALTGWGGVAGEFVVHGGEMATLLPLIVQQELYLVAQEALHNALKHAHARRIELTLSFAPDQVALDVRDDGVGFDAEAYRGSDGSGLHSMRERIRRIGGTLHIDSAPGQGTHVHVTV
jgi:signal transduction histidine kinase